jgi:hypothetical protein
MMHSISIPSMTGGTASLRVAPFSGTVVYRQTFARNTGRLWAPSNAPLRWSEGFNAVYTSLDLTVALAERVKRTGATRVEIVVRIARVQIRRVVTLDDQVLSALGTSREEVTMEDYTLPQRLGRALSERASAGLAPARAWVTVMSRLPRSRSRRCSQRWDAVAAIEERREPLGSAQDGLEAMRLVFAAYEAAKAGRTVEI